MGTRSLLAVEMKPGKYHVQYMQFDGYPSCKGKEFYEDVTTGLAQDWSAFVDKKGNPNSHFRDRVKNLLNNYQYASSHSIGNHWTCDAEKWTKHDCCQEWQYLWKWNGDFCFFNTYGESPVVTIPWAFTLALIKNFCDPEDIKEVYAFFERDALNNSDNFGKNMPILKAVWGDTFAFPDQGKDGWRSFANIFAVYRGKETLLSKSTFSALAGFNPEGLARNVSEAVMTVGEETDAK